MEKFIPSINYQVIVERISELKARAENAEARLLKARLLVAKQADDEGLWFQAATAPEAYLQQELRRLHAAIENKEPNECALNVLRDDR